MVMGELPEHAELLVVGGGPGGYAAAFRAADLGMDVTLVSDEERLGGVCLLRGCIPSKALLETVETMERARELAGWGVRYAEPDVDVARLRERTDEVVGNLADGLAAVARQRGVTIVQGRARFQGSDQARVSGGDAASTLTFDKAILATGSRPKPLPGVDFGGRVLDSTAALALEAVPERLAVVGGGYVGLELGSVYAGLGSEVTLVELADQLLPGVDTDLVRPLASRIEERFAAVRLQSAVTEIDARADAVTVGLDGDDGADARDHDYVLVAVGRRPNSDDLGLDTTSVRLDDEGFVIVDARRATTDRRLYAIGDVAGGTMLAHEAIHEGTVAAEAAAGRATAFDVRAMPAVVYTDPQVAWCGLTERGAAAAGQEVDVTTYPWHASGRARTMEAGEGLTKIVTEPGSGRVLGVGVVGRGAESLIAEGALAVEMGAVAADLALTVHPHPTLSETVAEAAARLMGQPVHLAR